MKNTTKTVGVLIIAPVIAGLILHYVIQVDILAPFTWCWNRIKEIGLTLIEPIEMQLWAASISLFLLLPIY